MKHTAPWEIRHVSLEAGIPALGSTSSNRVLVVFWWKGVPLGSVDLLPGELPLPASALAAAAAKAVAPAVGGQVLERGFAVSPPLPRKHRRASTCSPAPDFDALVALRNPLTSLEETLALPSPDALPHRLSVVICTRERPRQLARCLRSLEPSRPYLHEVVVVDNAPVSTDTREVVEATPDTDYLAEPRPGLSAARNAGIRRTTGDIIAFTDDDVVLHPEWAGRLIRLFSDPQVMCVCGQVLPLELRTDAQVAFERIHGGFSRGFRPMSFDPPYFDLMKGRGVPLWSLGAGANMAIRRRAFALVGDFDERLGAGAAGCSEDTELWYRLIAAGWTCRYDPTAVAFHEHRREWQELERQIYQYMRGHVAALLVQFGRHRHWGNLRRLALTLAPTYARLAARQIVRLQPLRELMLGARIRGSLAGLLALRGGPRRASED